ncbi:hypothetical protein G7084_00485 [Weissella coleopterorum]|uniref:Uncharacterized protein n=1 Tax=Weissella coleopterorum TaxID=2714949 RepID=A0A6G8AY99_9LACO|nr:TcpD family membrane protein [Weissella coleopterorum]QIL49935.1 hypothetical protein G7084_00485 [Weissella coleopterorum]
MDLYNALKPALLFFVAFATAGRALLSFSKNDMKAIWITIILGVAVFYFVNDPQGFLGSGNGLMNTVKNWISTLGG